VSALPTIERAFGDQTVHFLERDGALWLTRDELARCLGYADVDGVAKLAARHASEVGTLKGVVKLTTPGGAQEVVIYEERAVYLLACLARTEKGAAFRAWVTQTCHEIRTKDKILVDREAWERQQDFASSLLVAYERQAASAAAMASAAGSILALRRHTKPKDDPRQLLLEGVTFEELTDGAEASS
jgi:hypothetical protein